MDRLQRLPVCVGLKTYQVTERKNILYLNLNSASGEENKENRLKFKIVSNDNIATFIKELVLEPIDNSSGFKFKPGEYIHLKIPVHETEFKTIKINEPFQNKLEEQNFSITILSIPPKHAEIIQWQTIRKIPGNQIQRANCHTSHRNKLQRRVGSSYVFNLKPGDTIFATGPFGDFHIKDTDNEMVYVGGGAGMAPLRSQIAFLFETLNTKRKVSFWYGARSLSELYYDNYFKGTCTKTFQFFVSCSAFRTIKN